MQIVTGIFTYPLRLIFWILCWIARITMEKEQDAWILLAWILMGGSAGLLASRWTTAFMLWVFGSDIWNNTAIGISLVVMMFPCGITFLRLGQLVEEDLFFDYWNQPPPTLAFNIFGAKKAFMPPTFYFGNFRVQEDALFLNVICTGGIGSGKTAAFVYPFMDQLFREYNTRAGRENCGGLLLDVKGEFIDAVITLMKRHGRDPEKDLVVVNPDDEYTYFYNPIAPHMNHMQVAGRLRAILNNLGGGGGDSFWLDSAEKVVANAILLMRITHEWNRDEKSKKFANLGMVNQCIADESYLKNNLDKANVVGISMKAPPAAAPRKERIEFEDMQKNIKEVKRYFEKEWMKMAADTKSGIIAAVSNQLLRGFTDPKLQRVFCKTTDFSMTQTCNDGKIIVLQAPGWGMTAVMIGAALKLDFQQTMRERILPDRKMNQSRRCFFLCDEYQEYVTCGGKLEGDEGFYAVSRQSKIINAVATQSYESIYSKVGRDREAVRVLLQNMRVKICLNGEDSTTAKHVSELIGEDEFERTTSYIKNDKGSVFASGMSKTYSIEMRAAIKEYEFYRLLTHVEKRWDSRKPSGFQRNMELSYSEAIIFNGGRARGDPIFGRVRLKPIWIPDKEKITAKQYWFSNRAIVKIRKDEENRLTVGKAIIDRDGVPIPAAKPAPTSASSTPMAKSNTVTTPPPKKNAALPPLPEAIAVPSVEPDDFHPPVIDEPDPTPLANPPLSSGAEPLNLLNKSIYSLNPGVSPDNEEDPLPEAPQNPEGEDRLDQASLANDANERSVVSTVPTYPDIDHEQFAQELLFDPKLPIAPQGSFERSGDPEERAKIDIVDDVVEEMTEDDKRRNQNAVLARQHERLLAAEQKSDPEAEQMENVFARAQEREKAEALVEPPVITVVESPPRNSALKPKKEAPAKNPKTSLLDLSHPNSPFSEEPIPDPIETAIPEMPLPVPTEKSEGDPPPSSDSEEILNLPKPVTLHAGANYAESALNDYPSGCPLNTFDFLGEK